jgi:hypothetical protein
VNQPLGTRRGAAGLGAQGHHAARLAQTAGCPRCCSTPASAGTHTRGRGSGALSRQLRLVSRPDHLPIFRHRGPRRSGRYSARRATSRATSQGDLLEHARRVPRRRRGRVAHMGLIWSSHGPYGMWTKYIVQVKQKGGSPSWRHSAESRALSRRQIRRHVPIRDVSRRKTRIIALAP